MTLDVPNSFLQIVMPLDSKRMITKIRGTLVGILVEIAPEAHKDNVTSNGNKDKILHASMIKPLYGIRIES